MRMYNYTRTSELSLPPQPLLSFFFNHTATTEIYTLSLHDALPICLVADSDAIKSSIGHRLLIWQFVGTRIGRSEEHTSELQSPVHLVCRLLLEKKKNHK